ncbi:MAG: Flp family type IVb pilin [Chloroflexi bacterium]|nr:MAG: Flp family type IVb pilin [Chloroflexota bacterium]
MRIKRREEGQGLVEYALLLTLIALVVIGILLTLGPNVANVFSRVTSAMGNTTQQAGGAGNGGQEGGGENLPIILAAHAWRASPSNNVIVDITVSAPTSVTITDSQSGQEITVQCTDTNCPLATLTGVGNAGGILTLVAPGNTTQVIYGPAN